ncbi:DUF4124 domain-containing protein [Pseudomonas sp. LJDD11]|uniref:DUF4124 domain-containing protein n=1 Tax=Pseudomonas sp. LJDD11 TaxID=2931984 RepID=UPI00211BF22E|nr:DUF4124 domain-containing protein [Pseudomonas sp. LJDD11]MCQ9422028.1 DUF4124 domain-containing protein [Pseudomonas sp. LJDD11]
MRWMTLAAVLAMAMTATAQAAQIYKWVDAQGVTHYDATPPAGQQVESMDIQKPAMSGSVATPATPVDPQPAIDARVRKQAQAAEAKRTANCEIIRTNLAKLKAYARIREPTEDGSKRLTEEERQARIGETEKMIAEYCN